MARVDFHGASFAAPVYLGETRFQQGAWLAWEQIAGRVAPAKADTFAMLEENFTKLGDLRSQNEAHYWSEIYRGRELAGWSLLENQLWGALTGYGVKPLRVLAILALTAAVFLCLQLSPLFWRAVRRALPWGRGRVDGAAGSATEVGGASWRTEASLVLKDSAKTIFQLNPKDAQGRATIYVVEYAVMKLLLLLLAVTVANVSPVLRVFTRLLPV